MIEKNKTKLNKIFKKNHVVLAYLFGSAIRGKMTPLSDIDFAVLFSDNVKEKDYLKKELFLAYEIGKIFKIDQVDIVNLKTAKSPLLKYNIFFKGKSIYNKDKKKQFEMEKSAMKEYEDTKNLRAVQDYYLYKHIKEGTFGKASLSPKQEKRLLKIRKA